MSSVKINQFEAENVKRIKALTLTPAENGLTVIGGRNNQGKTSSLDAIVWALGGERYRPSHAVREGSVIPPRMRMELSNGVVVERSGKNSDLKVTDTRGRRAGQTLLNSFVEELALNMPKFMQSTSREKADTLLRIIGLEDQVRALEREEKELYDRRRAVGQLYEQKAKYAEELPSWPDAPSEPVSALELIHRQQDILARNGENQRKRDRAKKLDEQCAIAKEQMEDLEKRLREAREKYLSLCADCETARRDALDLQDESTEELEQSLRDVEAVNVKVRTNQDKARAVAEAKQYSDQYAALTEELETVRQKKLDLLNGADLPLPGLSVEDGELTYQGRPWDCMSGSDQLKVSTAIVRALKPECGFVLLDKLEQMDLQTLREFSAWMEAEGLQGIATRVSTGEECSIIIEDGCATAPAGDGLCAVPPPAPVQPAWQKGVF